ncbi:MAG: alcohol dehydrogenase catalytic domain-containing protein [bacterium]
MKKEDIIKGRMKAIVFKGKHKFELKEVPVPRLGEKDVLIKVDTCGVCGTDVHIYKGTFPADFPVIIGHEFAGTIEETGKGVRNFGAGDSVTVDPNTTCEQCEWCRKGQKHLCPDLVNLGIKVNGGFAEYARVKEAYVYHLPEDLDLESASFTEPLSCCLHGIDLAQIKSGDSLVILGAGPIGLLC